jgi:hypothetical protein
MQAKESSAGPLCISMRSEKFVRRTRASERLHDDSSVSYRSATGAVGSFGAHAEMVGNTPVTAGIDGVHVRRRSNRGDVEAHWPGGSQLSTEGTAVVLARLLPRSS